MYESEFRVHECLYQCMCQSSSSNTVGIERVPGREEGEKGNWGTAAESGGVCSRPTTPLSAVGSVRGGHRVLWNTRSVGQSLDPGQLAIEWE